MAQPDRSGGDNGQRDRAGDVYLDAAGSYAGGVIEPHRRALSLFTPSSGQWAIHQRLKRFNVLVCHRGFGKTVLAVNEVLKAAVDRPGTR